METPMILLVLAAAAVAFRFWMRMEAMESTIGDLSARIYTLEGWRAAAGSSMVAEQTAPTPVHATSAPTAEPLTPVPWLPRPADRRPTPPPVRPAPTPTSTPAASSAPSIPAPRPDTRDALETRIGSRWLLYIGVVAIIIGVSYFELAIDNHWVSETTGSSGAIFGDSDYRGASLRARGLPAVRPGPVGLRRRGHMRVDIPRSISINSSISRWRSS
jgi:uncharacterized membrane protein